jgi:hypothetical protein
MSQTQIQSILDEIMNDEVLYYLDDTTPYSFIEYIY